MILRMLMAAAVALMPYPVLAEADHFCSYVVDFGAVQADGRVPADGSSLRDCRAGDVVTIAVADSSERGLEAMYLAGEIAELCDNALPIAIVSEHRAVCTYRGRRRAIRRGQ